MQWFYKRSSVECFARIFLSTLMHEKYKNAKSSLRISNVKILAFRIAEYLFLRQREAECQSGLNFPIGVIPFVTLNAFLFALDLRWWVTFFGRK